MTIKEQLLQPYVGDVVDLWDIMLTDIGAPSNIYFTASKQWDGDGGYTAVNWQGNDYTQIPIEGSSFEFNMEGVSGRPQLSISNIYRQLIPDIASRNQLLNARVVRWRTFSSYIASNVYISKHTYIIHSLDSITPQEVKFTLASEYDREDAMIPFRTVLRDPHQHDGKTYQFPGVARDGSRYR